MPLISRLARLSYKPAQLLCIAVSHVLVFLVKKTPWNPSRVLHISYMVHIPYETVQLLREEGLRAEFLAIGKSNAWSLCDRNFIATRVPFLRAFQEAFVLWTYLRKFPIIHSHFMVGVSDDGWEWPVLKALGCKLVVHFRGCDVRTRAANTRIKPKYNICEKCDYNHICESQIRERRREIAFKYSDLRLVTTPDLLDFDPSAKYFPFFSPRTTSITRPRERSGLRIFHATNHPGIEGTEKIREIVARLKSRGWDIDFNHVSGASNEKVMEEIANSDVTIGKMKMGFYANAQIESLSLGVPAITYVRPEYVTEEIKNSGLILSSLESLEKDLEMLVTDRKILERKRSVARPSVERLHDNKKLSRELIGLYSSL